MVTLNLALLKILINVKEKFSLSIYNFFLLFNKKKNIQQLQTKLEANFNFNKAHGISIIYMQ